MIGIKIYRNDFEFRIPDHLVFNLNTHLQRLVVEGTGYFFSLQKTTSNIEYKLLISDFTKPSRKISYENDIAEVDVEFQKIMLSENWIFQKKLEEFRRLEAILKEEGLIE